ncbi:MAG TPA: aminopeptidase P family N-terminal domain-containing protein, partial [Puia sp.]|nr:aminopeptidase P family N-terminal domain-containing protein [Puia sp.]
MNLKRRNFIHLSTLVAGAAVTAGFQSGKKTENSESEKLISQTSDIVPITLEERKQRIVKAQQLLLQNKMDALVLESGTSLEYFTGVSWWPSERTLAAVIPSKGEIVYVCPGFEEPRFRELITIGNKVIVWQEDESPYGKIVEALSVTGTGNGKIGIEEQVRFFIYDGIRKLAPHLQYISGDPVTMPCRMIKSAAELALMQKATDITVAAMKKGMNSLKEGVS